MPAEQLSLQQIAAMPLTWAGYIIRPTDEKYADVADAPQESGIYGWYTSHGDLMYVGRSNSIRSRLRQHERGTIFLGGRPTFYSYKLVPDCAIVGVEVAHIKALAPRENSFMEAGCSLLNEQMIAAIEHVWKDAMPVQVARLDAQYSAIIQQIADRL